MNSLKRNMALIHPGELLKAELIEAKGLTHIAAETPIFIKFRMFFEG